MPPYMLPASYGGVTFWLTSLAGNAGRDVVVKSPARGDEHVLQDRGRRHRVARCELLFVDEPGKDAPDVRFRAFKELVDGGAPQIFTHPLEGSYRARVGEFEYSTRADDREIVVSCAFLAEGEVQTVFPPGAGAAPLAGLEEVTATVERAEEGLAEEGLTSATPRGVLDKVTAWTESETPDSRAVYLEVASLSQEIDAEIDRLELLTNLDRWPLYREFVNLGFQTRRAAESVTAEVDDVFDLVVSEAMPLRLLCAQLYGAENAEDKARQVAQINRVRTPGRVPAGTALKVPREGAR